MIKGIGIDIVEVARLKKMVRDSNKTFLTRCFTKDEIAFCNSKADTFHRFAGKLAAKEAVYKAMNLSWDSSLPWKEIEIRHSEKSDPMVYCSGKIQRQKELLHIKSIQISISHCEQYAVAVAVLEGDY